MKLLILTAATAAVLCGAAAHAGTANRAWVSGKGVDQAGCGAPTAPCRSLQYSHDNIIAAGGEIDILDPAGYGAITITKALSIVNDGVGTAGVQATSGNAITINAGPTDAVYLRGLNVDGVQKQATFGVLFNTGGSLTVANCVLRHFLDDGIALAPTNATANVRISDTVSSDNGRFGIGYFANAGTRLDAVFDHVTTSANVQGMFLAGAATGGVANFVIANSISSNNTVHGVWVSSSPNLVWALLDRSISSENGFDGLLIQSTAVVHLSRSVLDKNGNFGVDTQISTGGFFSSNDSHIDDNVAGAFGGPAPTPDTLR